MKFLALIVVLAACTNGASSTGIEQLSCPTDSNLTYANFGEDLIATTCMQCHDKDSPRLGTQALVQANASRILDNAVYTDSMPRGGGMSIEARRALGEWLACGAP